MRGQDTAGKDGEIMYMLAMLWITAMLAVSAVDYVDRRINPPDDNEKYQIAVRCIKSYMQGREVDVSNIINTTSQYVILYEGDVVYDYSYGDGCVLNMIVDKYGSCDSGGTNCDSSGKKYKRPDEDIAAIEKAKKAADERGTTPAPVTCPAS